MMAILTGCIAAALAWSLNRRWERYSGDWIVGYLGPVAEELLKTWLAYEMQADVWLAHLTFGGIEAVLDWQGAAGWRRGLGAAAASLAGHAAFGAATVAAWHYSGAVGWGVVAGCLLHCSWNGAVLYCSRR